MSLQKIINKCKGTRLLEHEPDIFNDQALTFRYLQKLAGKCQCYFAVNSNKSAAKVAYMYAHKVIKGPWPAAEQLLASDPYWAYWYANSVIMSRFLLGEHTISKDAYWSFMYSRDVVKGRFTMGEQALASDLTWAYKYARYVLHGRFPLCENAINSSPTWSRVYYDYIREIGAT